MENLTGTLEQLETIATAVAHLKEELLAAPEPLSIGASSALTTIESTLRDMGVNHDLSTQTYVHRAQVARLRFPQN